MKIIYSETELPFKEQKDGLYFLNINQRKVVVNNESQSRNKMESFGDTENDESEEQTKEVYEVYQETFKRFPSIREMLDAIKEAAQDYAKCDTIKKFTMNGMDCWLDSEKRASIKDAINACIDNGDTEYTLWLNSNPFEMSCESALRIISSIEAYASKCFNRESQINKQVENCGADIETACKIDFTQGYPEHPVFQTNE